MAADLVLPSITTTNVLSARPVLAYGALGLPLAFAALPIYVHVPRLYSDGLGVPLATVGVTLLAVRILDAFSDPLLGWASDRVASRRLLILLSLPFLVMGMYGLLAPPAGVGATWMGAMVFIVTLAFSAATINYGAWGAEIGATPDERTRIVASREAFALVGVVLAAALPGVLADDQSTGLAALAIAFVPIVLVAAAITLLFAPSGPPRRVCRAAVMPALLAALAHRPFVLLLAVFAANGIAAAIPATTVLFFVADVIGAAQLSGLFLVLYFIAGAASLPLWVRIARRTGKLRAWLASMGLAVVTFVWAWTLGPGDHLAFAAICVFSGMALGADLAIPPAMLADMLARDTHPSEARAGAWFGWWNFVTKANLALAAGLALPLLGALGYASGVRDPGALAALSAVYALVPVGLKLGAASLLWVLRHDLDFEGAMT
ncbi:MAG TPA: MFS transporter [Rhodocyclaceae bacterium]|nr:MFS transporter [Rhodocyclaceae bacterium]